MNRRIMLIVLTVITITVLIACGKKEDVTLNAETIETTVGVETVGTTAPSLPEGEGVEEILERAEETIVTIPTKSNIAESDPAEPKPTESKPTSIEPTEPNPTTHKSMEPQPTESKPTEPKPTEPPVNVGPCCEYDKYLAMSPAEQEAYMRTFSNPLEFIQWSQDSEAEHKAHDDTINVAGGDLNIGDYME